MYRFRSIEPMLVRMDERAVRRTWKYALRKTSTLHPDDELSPGEVLVFLTSTLLRSRGLIPSDGIEIIVEEIAEAVKSGGDSLHTLREESKTDTDRAKFPALVLVIVDRERCRLTGEKTWLDIRSGKRLDVASLSPGKNPPIEYDTLDLTALFFRSVRLLEDRLRAEAVRSKSSDPAR